MFVTLFKGLGILLLAIAFGIAMFLFGMRFHDGPMEIISGGPFETGTIAETPSSWAYLEGRDTIEFQTLTPATSRTVWLAVHEGRLFLISGYMNTNMGKVWKHWPYYLADDDRIILRIDGKLYPQRLQRLMQGQEILPVMQEFGRKYGIPISGADAIAAEIESGNTWLFEVLPRTGV